jgi:hypothetical protein
MRTLIEIVSHANRSILTTLVKGLVDNETKSEIKSKVERLTLDETVTFVEARETGLRSLAGLSGSGLASQVNLVMDFKDKECWKCGKKGHTGGTPAHILKKQCSAVNFVCKI